MTIKEKLVLMEQENRRNRERVKKWLRSNKKGPAGAEPSCEGNHNDYIQYITDLEKCKDGEQKKWRAS